MSIRTALAAMLVGAVMAIFAVAANATIAPKLTLNQSAGTAAGSSPAIAMNVDFTPLSGVAGDLLGEVGGDSVKNVTFAFPKGFMVNLDLDGGACVVASTPIPSCHIGSGVIDGPGGQALNMYLIAAPRSTDVAGVETTVEGGAPLIGELTLGTVPEIGFNLSYSNLSPGITALQLTLDSARLPSSCSPTENVTVGASSWQGSSGVTTAPLTVTGCNALPYAPAVAATVLQEGENSGALLTTTFTQPAGGSATSALEFAIPTDLKINRVLQPCLEEKPCTVGTVSAESPLLPPPALSSGKLVLGGTVSAAATGELSQLNAPVNGVVLTMSFPSPYGFSLSAPVDFTEHTITFSGMPDIPLTSLSFKFTGPPGGPAFATTCKPGKITATLTPQDGNPVSKLSAPVKTIGCPAPKPVGKPKASGALYGLASGRPKLRLHAVHGSNAPDIASLSIALPASLGFRHSALVKHRVCRPTWCGTRLSVRGLSLSRGGVARARIRGGRLVIDFKHPVGSVSLTADGPLLAEHGHHELGAQDTAALAATVVITDTRGHGTAVSVA